MVDMIKCRFCDWQTVKCWRTKKGKYRTGYWNLEKHVMMAHPDEYEKIQDQLDSHDAKTNKNVSYVTQSSKEA